ncbi:ATP-binding protein [Haladaptatus halobius]|uniref:ATP-binding protein n=1 Tax=Haladaptatus halobius TaxID=2884875 RepID=UPI001D0A6D46|nr:ATP-binding protein [Haladaptatus halobius]
MDDQENTTSTIPQDNSDYVLKNLIIVAVTTIVASLCYLFVPIGIFLAGRELSILLGGLISAILSLLAMWFLPPLVTSVFFEVLRQLAQVEKENMYPGWFLGAIIGVLPLTGIWFLPLWSHVSPEFAAILQPFRVESMLDNSWLMILSWLTCIPAQIMGLAHLEQGNSPTDTATSQQKLSVQKRYDQHARINSQKNRPSTSNTDEEAKETSSPSLSTLTFGWEPAPTTTFGAVGGMDDLKRDILRSVLRPLSHTDAAYERFNVSPPNGILLYGPPGTGKTHFARAIAGELGHPYLELSAGDIKSRWVNESTEKVNQLFSEAEQFERCVIFVDEIDALLAGRGNDLHREHAQVVNEFLAHLDDEDPNFLLIAATNRADLLDEAATRRGRFDQQYEVGLPDMEARKRIFRVRLRELPSDLDETDYETLAEQTADHSAADIVGIVDDAAMQAAERDAQAITYDDLVKSFPDSMSTK